MSVRRHNATANRSRLPRQVVDVSYASTRLRGRAAHLTFSENCRDAFSRDWWPAGAFEAVHGDSCLVDSAVTFVEDELVDHYGNVDRGVYGTPTGPTDLQTKIFWLPESDGGWMAEAEGEELPTWVEDAVAAWHDAQTAASGQAKL